MHIVDNKEQWNDAICRKIHDTGEPHVSQEDKYCVFLFICGI
jgi:hypothetical protein